MVISLSRAWWRCSPRPMLPDWQATWRPPASVTSPGGSKGGSEPMPADFSSRRMAGANRVGEITRGTGWATVLYGDGIGSDRAVWKAGSLSMGPPGTRPVSFQYHDTTRILSPRRWIRPMAAPPTAALPTDDLPPFRAKPE